MENQNNQIKKVAFVINKVTLSGGALGETIWQDFSFVGYKRSFKMDSRQSIS